MSIIEDFYKRGIPTPSGKARWSESTVLAWEDNIDTYLGHTVFNRTNEKLKVKGRSKGFLHGKKWKPKEEWEITENTHPPLITYETAEKIRGSRKKRMRATPRHAQQVYTLSGGIMVCSKCGTNYAGDRGYYSCNSKGKTGPRCSNGSIKRERIESILFSLIEKKILNFRDVKEVIGRIKERFNGKEVKIPGLNNKIDQIKGKVRKTISLYQQELIEQDELEDMISPLRQQQKTLEREIKAIKVSNEFQDVNDAMIKDVIGNLSREVANADPETKKRVVRTLFQSISIHPKKNQSRDRMLSIKGVCLPLTRDFLVTPRGIEPLLPA